MGTESVIQEIRHGCIEIFSLYLLSRLLCVMQNACMPKLVICVLSRRITKSMKHKKVSFIFRPMKWILIYLIFVFFFWNNKMNKQSKRWTKIELFLIYESISMPADWMVVEKKIQIQLHKRSSILELCKNERICELRTADIIASRKKTEIESIKSSLSSSSMNENLLNFNKKMSSTPQTYHEINDWICSHSNFACRVYFNAFITYAQLLIILYRNWLAGWLTGR